MSISKQTVSTGHADIAVVESSGTGLPVLLIHGNSSCKEVFRGLYEGPLGEIYRMIAMDLPGHGESSRAFNPERSYTLPGYAAAAVEVLEGLGIKQAAVYGWSLGGYVALEMVPQYGGLVGLMISGAPPVRPTPESIQGGYRPLPQIGLLGKPDLSEEEIAMLAGGTYGAACNEMLTEAVRRTDGRARAVMFGSLFQGGFSDLRALVETSGTPLAVVDGADDPFVNVEYVGSLNYASLWDEHCYTLRGAAHVPFLQTPEAFSAIFGRFLGDMEKRVSEGKSRVRSTKAVAA